MLGRDSERHLEAGSGVRLCGSDKGTSLKSWSLVGAWGRGVTGGHPGPLGLESKRAHTVGAQGWLRTALFLGSQPLSHFRKLPSAFIPSGLTQRVHTRSAFSFPKQLCQALCKQFFGLQTLVALAICKLGPGICF